MGEHVTDGVPTQRLRAEVLSILPHDASAFTQGLLMHEGLLYESTGLHGQSSLRAVDRESGNVLQIVDLEPKLFGEGLAQVADRLIQLTWQEGVALVYDLASLQRVSAFSYAGEGWGLCYDGKQLVMSDGSSTLSFRDPDSFEVRRTVTVKLDGLPLDRLNELECVGDDVYANVWLTDTIVRIEAQSGRVEAVIDASGLLSPVERRGVDVLNGIAYDPQSQTFLVTGKLWPSLFEVHFVE
ncbi:MAG: glutaminyl-peptide cyclotransferase [Chloroflexi bacterium]|nr:glutaminyl-peptide cyclotransferase [Chloroflexota bacterium]